MRLSSVAIDSEKSENGIWREIGVGVGFECLIARSNNSRFRAEIERRVIDLTKGGGDPSAEEYSEATLRAICEYVLLDWKGLDDDDDQPIPYTSEKAYEILSNPEYADIREAIEAVAASQKAYRREANLGNSQGSSSGGSSTEKTLTGTSDDSSEA